MRKELTILVIGVTALTWFAVAYLNGLPTTWWSAAKPFLTAITVAGVALWAYERHLWDWTLFRGWLTRRPCLKGVWQVEIHAVYMDASGNEETKLVHGYAQIDQTASTFCLRMFTQESRSVTVAHSFNIDQNVFSLAIVYENKPDISLRQKKSAFHQGSAVFIIRGHHPESFSGEYWTERKSVGSLILSNRKLGEISSFNEGGKIYHGN